MKRDFCLWIVSGLSGAGKTQALRVLEDLGYFCVDNFLPALIPPFVEMVAPAWERVAVVVDSRGGHFLHDLSGCLHRLKDMGIQPRILFLEAQEDALITRFRETRRRHPLYGESSLPESIRQERDMLAEIRGQADLVIDSTGMAPQSLKELIREGLGEEDGLKASLHVTVMSFGFRHGVPLDADLVFDVRFLPNPHYIPDLKPKTGLDEDIQAYLAEQPQTGEFLERLEAFIGYLLPHYHQEGKSALTIAIGCTGGRHRSVAIAHALCEKLEPFGFPLVERHRDLFLDPQRYEVKGP